MDHSYEKIDQSAFEIDCRLKQKRNSSNKALKSLRKENKNLTITSNFEAESNVSTTASSN